MEYFKLLQLHREPFSNSPDPDYFFHSCQHHGCLQKLELALRLKRGLNVVIGDVGTGKTTLCRHLIRSFNAEHDFESHLILDPAFNSSGDFLNYIHALICDRVPKGNLSEMEIKESIKQELFSKGVEKSKTIVLIIDEGQKISGACIEILRELLNYETNTFKLLQIVIFAQLEFEAVLNNHANFTDRVNLLHYLEPLNFSDTRKMVQHRIKLSSIAVRPKDLFTLPAMWAIYLASRGYPRKIIHLCHQSMLAMIIQNRSRAGWSLIRSCDKRLKPVGKLRRRILPAGLAAMAVGLVFAAYSPMLSIQTGRRLPDAAFKIEASRNRMVGTEAREPDSVTPMEEKPAPVPGLDVALDQQKSKSDDVEAPLPLTALAQQNAPDTPMPVPPANPPQTVSESPNPPELLGQLTVKPGDTMIGLIYRVYGTRRNSCLREVIRVNPHIQNPNDIAIGHIIYFPSMPVQVKTIADNHRWIILSEHQNLPQAIKRLYELKKDHSGPARIIPHWSSQSGLRFQVVVQGYFIKEEEADRYLRSLPVNMGNQARIVSGWPVNAILYSDPFAGGVRQLPKSSGTESET